MRGIVFDGEKMEVADDLEIREAGPRDVAVRIRAAGVCHSDLSVVDGTIPFPTPVVLGHEGAGVVEAVGADVTAVEVGDHVVLTTLGNCGLCSACETGHPTLCKQTFGKLPRPFTRQGEPLYMFANTSVFSEVTVVRESQAVPIDRRMPLETASLLGCGVITGMGAVFNRARVRPGDRVAVFGAGGIGLNVVQAAAASGASSIVAVDTVAGKERLARQLGATAFVDASSGDSVEQLEEILPDGVDHSFECVGHPAVLRDALEVLDWGGTCIVLGVPPAGTEASFVVADLYLDRGILGCRYGSGRPRHDIPMIVDLYLDGKLELDELVSGTYPLDGFETALDDMKDGKLARGVLRL